jgi:hypothetical protein
MTSKVRFLGWSRGMKKVALTKLIREAAGMPLNEAHDVVNRLLAGQVVDLDVASEKEARELADAARALGTRAEYIETELRTGTDG